jgi:hypothetical protein
MHLARCLAFFGCLAALCVRAGAEERNWWPVAVTQLDAAGHVMSSDHLGPFIFKHPSKDPSQDASFTTSGFRPFFVQTREASGMATASMVLYPLFICRADSDTYQWMLLNLIHGSGPKRGVATQYTDPTTGFDLWPFWFSRDTGSPETSYHALFPIAGRVKYRFWRDDVRWFLWPLYLRTEKNGLITTSTPWPFIQTVTGTQHGFALWPVYGRRSSPTTGAHHSFFLWPLGWANTIPAPANDDPDAPPAAPTRQFGFIPFYTIEQHPGFKNQNYVWPFIGHTERTEPYRYSETRYFWPFFVQGRGDLQMIDRWGPFYTHSVIKGTEKTWYLWPLVKRMKWEDPGVAQTRTQFLYLLYWSQQQRSLTNPHAAPAERTTVWPLFIKWDNGAGRRQFQVFSPFDVLLPTGNEWRETWTPFFAVYRFDQRAPADKNWSLLWGLATWHDTYGEKEFHLGPLFSVQSRPQAKRVAFGNGLFGWKRAPGEERTHWFWFDFPPKVTKLPPPST